MPSEPTVLPNRNNPLGDAGGGGCTMRIVGLLFIFVYIMRVWIISVLEYVELEESHGQWTQTNATVVGVNNATQTRTYYTQEFAKPYFCPLLNYETTTGENITATGHSGCFLSMNETSELVGNNVQVRYDPHNPEEFVEQDAYESEMKLLTMIISCGVSLSILFGFVLIRTIMTGDGNNDEGEEVTGLERKTREELIRSKFQFQKVSSDDKGNMNIANIDSKWENICENKEEDEKVDTPDETDEELGCESSSSGPAQEEGGICSSSTTPSMMLPSLASTFAVNSTLLSSWRRPAGVTECVICLEEYKPDEIICTAKTAECDHVFHEKCVTSWLLANHDDCPLCRVNLLKG